MSLCFKYIYCSEKTNPHKGWDWIFGQPERRILIWICPLVCVWRKTPNTSGILSLIFVLNISSPVLKVKLNQYFTEHRNQKDKSIWSEEESFYFTKSCCPLDTNSEHIHTVLVNVFYCKTNFDLTLICFPHANNAIPHLVSGSCHTICNDSKLDCFYHSRECFIQ